MNTHIERAPAASQGRAYLVRTGFCMVAYVLINLAAILGFFDSILGRPSGWLVAVAVALPVAGHIWATLRLMSGSDEYVRAIVGKCFVLAAGLTMALWTAWGFGETYAAAVHMPGWLIYPFFLAMYALAIAFVRTSH